MNHSAQIFNGRFPGPLPRGDESSEGKTQECAPGAEGTLSKAQVITEVLPWDPEVTPGGQAQAAAIRGSGPGDTATCPSGQPWLS